MPHPANPANRPIPNPAFDRLRTAGTPKNDQVSLFALCDPDATLVIARRLGTRYTSAA